MVCWSTFLPPHLCPRQLLRVQPQQQDQAQTPPAPLLLLHLSWEVRAAQAPLALEAPPLSMLLACGRCISPSPSFYSSAPSFTGKRWGTKDHTCTTHSIALLCKQRQAGCCFAVATCSFVAWGFFCVSFCVPQVKFLPHFSITISAITGPSSWSFYVGKILPWSMILINR